MNSADLWLQHLATQQNKTKKPQTHTAAMCELWEELQRCAAIFNFHRRDTRNIKVFQRNDNAADIIFARATARLTYRKGQLQLQLFTIAEFAEQEKEQTYFQPQLSNLGLLYWTNTGGQKFNTNMLIQHIFEHLLEHTP